MDNGIDDGWISSVVRRLISALLQRFDVLPKHIGIVMDGNRRYARLHGHTRKDGHASGFKSMSRLLAVAYSAHIPEITVYAFSIENFNRTPEEVADLMDIARSRLVDLIAHRGIAQQFGVRINVLGRLEMLPEDIQQLAYRIMSETKDNQQAVLNLAMPYTARDDMASAIATAADEAAGSALKHSEANPIDLNTVDSSSISRAMHTSQSRPLDLLIRTSDTHRLSDFLLWEITETTMIDFVSELWPEYTPVHFLRSILRWRDCTSMRAKMAGAGAAAAGDDTNNNNNSIAKASKVA